MQAHSPWSQNGDSLRSCRAPADWERNRHLQVRAPSSRTKSDLRLADARILQGHAVTVATGDKPMQPAILHIVAFIDLKKVTCIRDHAESAVRLASAV